MFSGGEDVGALVLDCGSSLTKLGYAGEHIPRAVYPSAVSMNQDMDIDGGEGKGKNSKYALDQALYYGKYNQELIQPVERGITNDFDALEAMIQYGIEDRLGVQASLHPLLVSESIDNPSENREKLCQMLFETMECPAIFLARDAMLSALAMGRTTALVVECGAGSTRVVPVHDGYALSQSSLRTKLGGNELDKILANIYEKGLGGFSKPVEVVPRYKVKRSYTMEVQRSFEIMELESVNESYDAFMKGEVLRDLKETVCTVSDVPFVAEENLNIPTFPYQLPDGNTLSVGPPRFLIPEMLFTPSADFASLSEEDYDGYSFPGLATMIDECIGKCDVDLRKDLFANICLVGGGSKMPGLSDRLQSDLETAAGSTFKVKILSSSNTFENQYSAWVGGSILASIGTFQQMWFSKSEYEEDGIRLLGSRCP